VTDFLGDLVGQLVLVDLGDGEEVTGEIVEEDRGFRIEWWEVETRFERVYRITVPEVVLGSMSPADLERFQGAMKLVLALTRKYR